MHLFLRGKPACGKTTLIKNILPFISDARGFFTQELRRKEERLGFKICTLEGKEAIFAHRNYSDFPKVSHYGVDLKTFEAIALEELGEALKDNSKYVVIDELGRMELLSLRFKELVLELLEKKRVIGTMAVLEDPFLEKIILRNDACVLELEKGRFLEIRQLILLALESLKVEEIRALEKKAIALGLEERTLIENASSNLAQRIKSLDWAKRILVLAGKGNNAADVLACARKLLSWVRQIKVVVLSPDLKGEALFQLEILKRLGVPIIFLEEGNLNVLEELLCGCDCILDGIFGIGLKGEIPAFIKGVIQRVNQSGKKVVACDIPSGLEADTGRALGIAIKADLTVTFLAPKEGFFFNEAKAYCGKIVVEDIGISRKILEKGGIKQ